MEMAPDWRKGEKPNRLETRPELGVYRSDKSTGKFTVIKKENLVMGGDTEYLQGFLPLRLASLALSQNGYV